MVTVNDPYYLLLVLSCIAVLLVLAAAKYRESDVLVHVVLCGELGLLFIFLWNTTVPDSIVISRWYLFVIAEGGFSVGVYCLVHSVTSAVIVVLSLGLALWLVAAGRDTVEGWFGGLSDAWLGIIFAAMFTVLLLLAWWIKKWKRVWHMLGVLFMGVGLTLAVDVIYQEIDSGNQNLDLLDFTDDDNHLSYILAGSEAVTLLLYYRHVFLPCCFTYSPPPKPPPSPPKKAKKKPGRRYYSGLPLSESELEMELPSAPPPPPSSAPLL